MKINSQASIDLYKEQKNIAFNKTYLLLQENPQFYQKIDTWLTNHGIKEICINENGSFALVGKIGPNEIIRLVDSTRERERENIDNVLQPTQTTIISLPEKEEQLKIEILPRLTTYENTIKKIGQKEAEALFRKGREVIEKKLHEKGFVFKKGVNDDSFRNLGFDEHGNCLILDADCIKNPEREKYERALINTSDFLKEHGRMPSKQADMNIPNWHQEVALAQRWEKLLNSKHLPYLTAHDTTGLLKQQQSPKVESSPTRPSPPSFSIKKSSYTNEPMN